MCAYHTRFLHHSKVLDWQRMHWATGVRRCTKTHKVINYKWMYVYVKYACVIEGEDSYSKTCTICVVLLKLSIWLNLSLFCSLRIISTDAIASHITFPIQTSFVRRGLSPAVDCQKLLMMMMMKRNNSFC